MAASSKITLDNEAKDVVAYHFKFRADTRVTQKTLDEAREHV
jgi:hypothetical protein